MTRGSVVCMGMIGLAAQWRCEDQGVRSICFFIMFFFFFLAKLCMHVWHTYVYATIIYLSTYPSIYPFICLYHLSIHLYIQYLSIHPSIYLSIHLSTTSITRFTIHPLPPPFPPWYPNVCFLCLCFYFHFANRFICTTYLGPLHMH